MRLTTEDKKLIVKALSVFMEDRYEMIDNATCNADRTQFRGEALDALAIRETIEAKLYH